ncbi:MULTISPECIES: RNA polymerase sigma factor FliA [Neptunomonas]|uniref:RNA polymerase sigma factor FliA n=1 Tax=Neptunomonas marina TaxID=1815562 RepID=A0A437Q6Z0_9GAMM|nr:MULTISPECIES: RNA polymerase sigma factor FliA [Neptunomonas]RVU30280.1 RNA polymerase sigma factor FliA [Neptunomonas marina]
MYNPLETTSSQDLIEQHAPLVKRIAHHLMARLPASVVVDDLIQAGMIGLLEAAKKYDASKGASFETYAGIRIRGSIIDEVRRGDWTPRSVHRNGRRISEAIQKVEAATGRDASDTDIAQEMGVSVGEYHDLLKDSVESRLFSFETLTGNDEEGPGEQLSGDDPGPSIHAEKNAFMSALVGAIDSLPEREKLVLSLYYDEELNLKEIGEVLGVSESRVSQIHSQAAHRLRGRLRDWQ